MLSRTVRSRTGPPGSSVGLAENRVRSLGAPIYGPLQRQRWTGLQAAALTYRLKKELTIHLYDVLGRQVRTVLNDEQEGRHQRTLDVGTLPSGVYFLRLRAGDETGTERLTVVK